MICVAAWVNFHNDLTPKPGDYLDSPIDRPKVEMQLRCELLRLREATEYRNKTGDGSIKRIGTNERQVFPKATRNDCCMFGD